MTPLAQPRGDHADRILPLQISDEPYPSRCWTEFEDPPSPGGQIEERALAAPHTNSAYRGCAARVSPRNESARPPARSWAI